MATTVKDDYMEMYDPNNLQRAYRWIQSNPDVAYKGYFRDAYSAYAATSDANLERLRKNLCKNTYKPNHASKVYLPKPSGILRPYTLLTVNDQIVYQACINIIADKLKPITKKRYLKKIFGHLYAGKSSKWFYLKWQNGYKLYGDSIIKNVNNGFVWVANFDLASFYDSIDHNVIKHCLTKIEVSNELIDFLLPCLRTWTSNTWTDLHPRAKALDVIYHEHGIPQGPLSSGLLSEVVLQHIDNRCGQRGNIQYTRYVDDIKIFSKTEGTLRQMLVALDLAAKEIGLFPQSAKINIRKVTNPYEEIKSISRPVELSIKLNVDQKKVVLRLLEISRRAKIAPDKLTEFKYSLNQTEPTHKLNKRLMEVLKKQPALFASISYYFSRYKKLPRNAANDILEYLRTDEIYHAVHAALLFATIENAPDPEKSELLTFCYDRLIKPKLGYTKLQSTYKAALLAWTIHHNKLTYAEFHKQIKNEKDWWVIKDCLKYLDTDQYGKATLETFLNEAMRHKSSEVARLSAMLLIDRNLKNNPPLKEVHKSAQLLLHGAKRIKRVGSPESLVGAVLSEVLMKEQYSDYKWKKLLKDKHRAAEWIALSVKSGYESNINECIMVLDSLFDLIFKVLCKMYAPEKKYRPYGSMVKDKTLLTALPKVCKGFHDLHKLRSQSHTAHPRTRSGKETRRLKHSDYNKIRPKIQGAINEIIKKIKV